MRSLGLFSFRSRFEREKRSPTGVPRSDADLDSLSLQGWGRKNEMHPIGTVLAFLA